MVKNVIDKGRSDQTCNGCINWNERGTNVLIVVLSHKDLFLLNVYRF